MTRYFQLLLAYAFVMLLSPGLLNANPYTMTTYDMENGEKLSPGRPMSVAVGCNLGEEKDERQRTWLASTLRPEEQDAALAVITADEAHEVHNPYGAFLLKRSLAKLDPSTTPFRWLKVVNPETPDIIDAVVLLDRMPRGVVDVAGQEDLLRNYEKMGALTYDEESDPLKYQGKYRFVPDNGLLQMHVVLSEPHKHNVAFHTSILRGISSALAVLADTYPAQPYMASDTATDKVKGVMDYRLFTQDDSLEAALNAGWSLMGADGKALRQAPVREYWEPKYFPHVQGAHLLWKSFGDQEKAHVDFDSLVPHLR